MKHDLRQQSNQTTSVLGARFAWLSRLLMLIVVISLLLVCAACLGSTTSPQATKTNATSGPIAAHTAFVFAPSITPSKSSPTSQSSQWITTETFTGSGPQKTITFTAPKSWRIVWKCDLSSHNNASYDMIIHANTANNTLLSNSVETTCNKTNTQGLVMMHQAGQIYLIIISEGNWTIQVEYSK